MEAPGKCQRGHAEKKTQVCAALTSPPTHISGHQSPPCPVHPSRVHGVSQTPALVRAPTANPCPPGRASGSAGPGGTHSRTPRESPVTLLPLPRGTHEDHDSSKLECDGFYINFRCRGTSRRVTSLVGKSTAHCRLHTGTPKPRRKGLRKSQILPRELVFHKARKCRRCLQPNREQRSFPNQNSTTELE